MCIIIAKPKGKVLTEDTIRTCFINNPDGAGITYVDNDNLVITKGLMTIDALLEAMKGHEDKQMVLHFRIASPGMVVNPINCHPFLIESSDVVENDARVVTHKFAVAHNGRIEWASTAERSDTNMFCEQYLQPMLQDNPYILETEYGIISIHRVINTKSVNKMAIMRYDVASKESAIFLVNEAAGNWDSGCWFSNYSWRPIVRTHTPFGMTAEEWKRMTTPDAEGWVWSFRIDAWVNERLGIVANYVEGKNNPYATSSMPRINDTTRHLITYPTCKFVHYHSRPYVRTVHNNVGYKAPELDHLTKPEIKVLVNEANRILSSKHLAGCSNAERIDALRDKVREAYPSLELCNYKDLDAATLRYIKNGNLWKPESLNVREMSEFGMFGEQLGLD